MSVSNYQNFINGQFVKDGGDTIEVHNPANGNLLSLVPESLTDT